MIDSLCRLPILVLCLCASAAQAQLTSDDIAALGSEAEAKGWTFTVGESAAARRPLESLCGFKATPEWYEAFHALHPPKAVSPDNAKDLPAAYDWRTLDGVTAIRDQGACGSCWAFSMMGAFECAIKIHDGVEVDLSEQWLVSCNREGFGCGGSVFLFSYFQDRADATGEIGAVLEEDFPYMAYEADCNGPHRRHYWINDFGSAGSSVEQIKQSIYDYGPVSVSFIANSAFHAYSSGVFNACEPGSIFDVNHAVVLVGWDDALGAEGAWIMRNSWDDDWGEDGYCYIEYDCSQIGAFAAYVDFGGDLNVAYNEGLVAAGSPGGPFAPASQDYDLFNSSGSALEWTASSPEDWVTIIPGAGSLGSGEGVAVSVALNEYAGSLPIGRHQAMLFFENLTDGVVQPRGVSVSVEPHTVYSFPMDEDPGWTAEGQWAFGPPTGNGSRNPDPLSGYTGANVYGYNLDGDYANGMSETTLTTAALDCSAWFDVHLNFRRWLGVESATYDRAKVQVSDNGADWTTVWENPAKTIGETHWTGCTYDISAIAGHQPAVYVRWTMGPSDSSYSYSGWNIDDVTLTAQKDGESAFEFTEVPRGAMLMEGEPLVLTVGVSGAVGEVSYQWIKDGAAIAGAITAEFEIETVAADDTGWYCCRAWDQSKGVRTTEPVFVRVYAEDSLPVGAAGLCLAALGCLSLGALSIIRRRG